MANPEHVAIVKQGAEAIAEWRDENPNVRLDLQDADFRGAHLCGIDLSNANLGSATLPLAQLTHANLCGANLRRANLIRADLRRAKLCNTDLESAFLDEANLSGASLAGARVAWTSFGDLDLSEVDDLHRVDHRGPSTVGIDTLYKSRGMIPKSFLRGCGVPDGLVEYTPALLGMQKAIEFYSCFISYSHEDEEFCKRLYSRMRDEHLRVWYAPEDMAGGKKLHEQIDDAIHLHDKLLIVLSDKSMSSEWVKTEVRKARKREETEGKRVLFPIRLVSFDAIRDWEAFDADTGKDMAAELREYFIPDFSNWKDHDAFESAFKRLLDDLNKVEESSQSRPSG